MDPSLPFFSIASGSGKAERWNQLNSHGFLKEATKVEALTSSVLLDSDASKEISLHGSSLIRRSFPYILNVNLSQLLGETDKRMDPQSH